MAYLTFEIFTNMVDEEPLTPARTRGVAIPMGDRSKLTVSGGRDRIRMSIASRIPNLDERQGIMYRE